MATVPHAWPRSLTNQDRKRIRELIQSLDMEVVALQPTYGDINLTSPRDSIRNESIKELKEQIELASYLGAEIVVVVIGRKFAFGTPPLNAAWNWAKAGIMDCAKHANDFGITIGLENVPNSFVETTEQLRKMIEETRLENVKAVFDTSNNNVIEKSPRLAIKELGDLLVHVHLADNDGVNWSKLPIGSGNINFQEVARSLEKAKFKGWSVLEIVSPKCTDAAMKKSRKKLESIGWKASPTNFPTNKKRKP